MTESRVPVCSGSSGMADEWEELDEMSLHASQLALSDESPANVCMQQFVLTAHVHLHMVMLHVQNDKICSHRTRVHYGT